MTGWSPTPVLMYHDIADDLAGVHGSHRPYVVPTSSFRSHLVLLSDLGFLGSRLDALLGGGGSSADRRCVITFDDGHASNYTRALPALLEAGFSATFFVTVGWIGQAPYMSWDEIKTLAAAGMEIGSHSMSHRPPATLTRAELVEEMTESRRILEERIGRRVVTASSPTGFFNPALVPVAREAGYEGLCYGRIALWKDPRDAFRIPRLPVKDRTTLSSLRAMALGDRFALGLLRAQQMARNGLKRALGVGLYRRLRDHLIRYEVDGDRLPTDDRPRPRRPGG